MASDPLNGERYISWKVFLTWVIPSVIAVALALSSFTVWAISSHAQAPHPDAVSYREFKQLQEDIKFIKQELLEMRLNDSR